MRLHERGLSSAQAADLMKASHERGVTMFHSSSEYESYPLYLDALKRMTGTRPAHMVKLADPHFGEASFDSGRFEQRIDEYLSQLGAETLDVVQWMWRGDLKQEAQRLDGLRAQRDEMLACFGRLKQAGKIRRLALFPYSTGFASLALELTCVDALVVYLNPLELEMVPNIQQAASAGVDTIAIRPLSAGKALEAGSVEACVRFVLEHPGVSGAVVTYSTLAHLDELLQAESF